MLVEEVEVCVVLWVFVVEWDVEVDIVEEDVEVDIDVDVGAEEVDE